VSLSLVFVGCCANVFSQEFLNKIDAGCGNILTFCQFAGVSIFTLPALFKPRYISFSNYLICVVFFFTVSVVNNKALDFDISMPFHMVVRSGSLTVTLLINFLVFRKTFTVRQVLAVILVTGGIIMASIETASLKSSPLTAEHSSETLTTWFTGIAMLVFTLVLMSFYGVFQSRLMQQAAGSEASKKLIVDEMLFFVHALSLPCFLPLFNDMHNHVNILLSGPRFSVLEGAIKGPVAVPLLIINVASQVACIKGVYSLNAYSSSLTATMATTLRKFVSLCISVYYFDNPFTITHWLSTGAIFMGSFLYFLPSHTQQISREKKEK